MVNKTLPRFLFLYILHRPKVSPTPKKNALYTAVENRDPLYWVDSDREPNHLNLTTVQYIRSRHIPLPPTYPLLPTQAEKSVGARLHHKLRQNSLYPFRTLS